VVKACGKCLSFRFVRLQVGPVHKDVIPETALAERVDSDHGIAYPVSPFLGGKIKKRLSAEFFNPFTDGVVEGLPENSKRVW